MTNERRAVQVGETYGRLFVIEELEGRSSKGTRLYRCRCVAERDGAECGNVVVRGSHQLTSIRFRACDRCQSEHKLAHRKAYGSSFLSRCADPSHGGPKEVSHGGIEFRGEE